MEGTEQDLWDEAVAESGGDAAGDTLADRLQAPAPETQVDEQATDDAFVAKADPEPDPPAPKEKPAQASEEDEEVFDPKALMRAVAQLSTGIRDLNGRFGGLNQQISTLKTEVATAKAIPASTVASGEDAPTQKQIEAASKDPEKWKALKSDFPEWGDGIEEFVNQRIADAVSKIAREAPRQDKPPAEAPAPTKPATSEYDVRLELETMKTKSAHPDMDDIVKSDSWSVFLAGLPPQMRSLTTSSESRDAIFLLDHYKQTRPKALERVVADRKERLRQSVSPVRTQATPRRSIVSENDMTPQQLFDLYAKQEMAGGR